MVTAKRQVLSVKEVEYTIVTRSRSRSEDLTSAATGKKDSNDANGTKGKNLACVTKGKVNKSGSKGVVTTTTTAPITVRQQQRTVMEPSAGSARKTSKNPAGASRRKAPASSSSSSMFDKTGKTGDGVAEVFLTDGPVEVKNVLGSSASTLANAKRHWLRFAGKLVEDDRNDQNNQKNGTTATTWNVCRKLMCKNPAEHGAHVKVPSKSLWQWYIVPLCHRCNPRSSSETFVLKPKTLLVEDHKASCVTHIKSWVHHVRPFISTVRSSMRNVLKRIVS